MITPSFGLTATERVLPRLALDWTTGLAQLGVDVTRAGVATFVGSNGFIESASTNSQRVDYLTGTAGLLVEEARQNQLPYSQTLDDVSWSTTNATSVSVSTKLSPDGVSYGYNYVPNTVSTIHDIFKTITATANTVYTSSCFFEKGEYRYAFLTINQRNSGAFVGQVAYVIDLETGAVGSALTNGTAPTSTSVKVDAYRDGWYRLCVTGTTAATGVNQVRFNAGPAASLSSISLTGDAIKGINIWGAQLEAGAFATSYIPTTTTAVTRNADVATMTGTNFSDWYNPTEGTFSIDCIINTNSAAQILMEMSDGTSANRFQYQRDSGSNNLSYLAIVSGSISVNLSKTATFVNDAASIISAYKLNNYGIAVNGGATTTDTSSGVPIVDRMRIGATVAGAAPSSGWYQKLFYYPQRLTNAEIQAFSK